MVSASNCIFHVTSLSWHLLFCSYLSFYFSVMGADEKYGRLVLFSETLKFTPSNKASVIIFGQRERLV